MLPFTTECYHWVKKVNRTVLRGVLEAFVGRFLDTALARRRERDGNDMDLRARILSIASFAEGSLLLSEAPDAQDKFHAFDLRCRCLLLTDTDHTPPDE